jgi:type VI secretion system protein ImpC
MSRRLDDSAPMRILLLGDFSGDTSRERPPLASRPTHAVDLDTIGDVMRRLAPRVRLPQGEIPFNALDDFHPDRLFTELELFRALRDMRAHPPAEGDELARLLGQPAGRVPAQSAAPLSRLDALIHEMIAPHIVKETSAHDRMFAEAVDETITYQMRELLHAPPFQSLEAQWRGVHWLISSLELDEHLQLHLFDVTRDEILGDIVAANGKLASTGAYHALVERWRNVPGGQGWAAIIGLFDFGQSDTDVGLLASLGLIAAKAGAPLLAGAAPPLFDDAWATNDAWNALRRSEVAPWIGLAAPRVLLRLPYGPRTDPITTFSFEEVSGAPAPGELLWGNASLVLAVLIGRSFTARGWDMELGDERELGDLPAYTFTRDGESHLQSCGEQLLTETQIQRLLDTGLIPIASRRDRAAVVAVRFQSIAHPPAALVW